MLLLRYKGVFRVKISTRGRYALRMMADLAQHSNESAVALKDIAQRQGISKKYLEQIVPLLSKTGYLTTSRGFQGGYRLSKEPKDCYVGQILRCTEGSLAPVSCLEDDKNMCKNCNDCLTLPIWEKLEKLMCEYLDSISLEDIIDRKIKK